MTTTPALNDDLVRELNERAASYRLGGPSSEHTAALLEQAAEEIEALRSALEPFAGVMPGLAQAMVGGMAERLRSTNAPSAKREARQDFDAVIALADAFQRARTALKGA